MFRDCGLGDWLGFYDWLRTTAGEVIGVQLWVDEPRAIGLLQAASSYVGVEASKDCLPFRVFFKAERQFDEQASCDQDFGSNLLLRGNSGLVLTFNAPSK